jgi:transcriptional regulator with XRE-family HTH domain
MLTIVNMALTTVNNSRSMLDKKDYNGARRSRDMDGEEPTSLATRLRVLRKAHGLTQAELAEAAGISRNHLHRIEAGTRRNISPTILRSLAQVLHVSVDELTSSAPLGPLPDPWLLNLGARLDTLPAELSQRMRQLIEGFVAVVETPFVAYSAALKDLLGEETELSEAELQEVAQYALTLVRRQAVEGAGADGAGRADGIRT